MKHPQGKYITIDGEKFYEIKNYDRMQPFFISLASDTDLWMYLSSTGGLTCGRRSPDFALFPYYTDDKITQNYTFTGPRTLVRLISNSVSGLTSNSEQGERTVIWEPFSVNNDALFRIERRICKSVTGNVILFEETNQTLGLLFRYSWQAADRFGWVRKAYIENIASQPQEFELIDGVQNVLPSGVNRQTQNVYSTLVDGYKKTEQAVVEREKTVSLKEKSLISPLVLFRMEAIMVDKAEPSESLTCNTVYSIDADDFTILTSSMQLDAFRHSGTIHPEPESKGVQGAYLLYKPMNMEVGGSREWMFVMDVEKDASDVHAKLHEIVEPEHKQVVLEALQATTANLRAIVAHNDGVQLTGDEAQDARHFANVLFNTMRGGYYADDYTIHAADFAHHVKVFNTALYEQYKPFLDSLPEQLRRDELEDRIIDCMDHQLHRLFMEYLPLTFSRRHGDPSRPWNSFDIRVKDKDGKPLIAYQGNWRDIFQNWEALSASYPDYTNAIIAKFLNATTADGYNPYRITSEGIDWEVINPDDPWSNIGYWGDHQIIYLCKLLELSRDHDPKALLELLARREFAFAAVPYRIKSYKDIVANPKDTIRFDDEAHQRILSLIPTYGQDARLMLDKHNQPVLVTGAEKLLITMLAKLSNHIPGAGIWMNTLRPEWNDANNALVGNGASMVTVCYLYRYMQLLRQLFTEAGDATYAVHAELVAMMRDLLKADSLSVRAYVDAVGLAGEAYRNAAYAGFSGQLVELTAEVIADFLERMMSIVKDSILSNRREDGLYNAYNLVKFTKDNIEVTELYEMLEGQVAVLSSGLLSAAEAADLLDAMRKSALYREDQQSYMLYPARRRPAFLEMNNLPADAATLPVVQKHLGTVLKQDCDGGIHFDAKYRNANNLPDELKDLYEQVFNHHAFTGRSGTFYKYEGLGSIYWHMVSKLLLAVGENIRAFSGVPNTNQRSVCGGEKSVDNGALNVAERHPEAAFVALVEHYRAIKEGLGLHKSPEQYGSFPFDAYSHTPAMSGVQQPGMTGQVKEDILSRWFELGIEVRDGAIHIHPLMLRKEDFRDGKLSFTYCGTTFTYHLSESDENTFIPQSTARHIFARDGLVKSIDVYLGRLN
ncbi:MAG: hypothetical protein IJT12_03910 [Paludibacteraceae bacterium]|nr:hypothetical protein [Paludibacteraceae bacterium]